MSATRSSFPSRKLGPDGPTVSAIGFGAGGFGDFYGTADKKEAPQVLTYAANHGISFWDTSDFYRDSEKIIGEWFANTGRREEIFLATKFGANDLRKGIQTHAQRSPCSDPDYIVKCIEKSLKDLQTDYIDLYYQHRVDPSIPIEIVMETLRPFIDRGTIRWLGLSECSATTLRRAKAIPGIGEKLVAVQLEYSPFERTIETNGLFSTAKELGVAVVAYSPLGRGLITGRFRSAADFGENDLRRSIPRFSAENFPKNLALADAFKTLGEKYDATPAQTALAWLLAQDPHLVPIPGATALTRVEENSNAAFISLMEQDVKDIRNFVEEADIQGTRTLWLPDGNCIELAEWKARN
ncbi:Aldo-ket-red domain-containing protein [Mycena indigotica]|uniref:Aldo-ket-red domain-containing protein n=1 Tax=Mycena indigotica TaxID=2126181 RepID=A0A8H6SE80_9AGAR|nr:Aldo-ket-red domain-containing protein [Mycena indigotica]KAF7297116.1 Aldo-ket-red domain-containing protein [Mycena indigotica]